jgi:pantoate--beta-alanine ligase
MPVRVVVVPTLRESDGLALSSRNVYLQPLERAAAPSFHRALAAVARALGRGECDVRSAIDAIALDAPLVLEYAAVVDPDTFEPLETVRAPALVVGVARAGATRLLDNVPVAFGGEGEA